MEEDISMILSAVERGEPAARDELLRVVYHQLRGMAAKQMAGERPGHTLQATALVHEAYLRLFGNDPGQHWAGRRHFFEAASEAMRRILVEKARSKKRLKRGGGNKRVELDEVMGAVDSPVDDLIALHEALDQLACFDPVAASLVKLSYFSGLPIKEAIAILGLPERTAFRKWKFAKAWLHARIHRDDGPPRPGQPV